MIDNRTFFSSKGIIQQAPLYLYETEKAKKRAALSTMMLFDNVVEYGKAKGKKANIAPKVFEQLEKAYGKVPTPEQILGYCYAVLYSNAYREKFAEFLKIDFPRIPFTKNYDLFKEMSKLGEELIELHLLKHKALNKPILKYFGKGKDDTIVKPRYDEERRIRVHQRSEMVRKCFCRSVELPNRRVSGDGKISQRPQRQTNGRFRTLLPDGNFHCQDYRGAEGNR